MKLLTILLLALTALNGSGASLSIPSDRLPGGVLWTNWSPGVMGGIPNVTTVYSNISTTGDSMVDWTNIEASLLLCPSNQAVVLSAGTYTLPRALQWGPAGSGGWFGFGGNNGVVLRGVGTGKTILNFVPGLLSVNVTGNGYSGSPFTTNDAHLWTAGYAQGSTNITLATTVSGLTNGDMICLTEEIDPTLVQNHGIESVVYELFQDIYTNLCYEFQWVKVTGVSNGTNLTIWPGVYMTNYQASLRPQMLWAGTHDPAMNCGIDSLTINAKNLDSGRSAIYFTGAFSCWVTNVEVQYPWFAAVDFNYSAHDTVQGCYFHDSASGGASTSYGVYYATCSDVLAENNIFYRISAPALFQFGSSGNVFAYNYCTNMIFGASPGWTAPSLNFHGAHPTMNLCEGNIGTAIAFDCVHGSSSHNIIFRNWAYGFQGNLDGYQSFNINNTDAVSIMSTNRYVSLIGNVLGTVGINTNYEDSVQNYPTNYAGVNKWLVYWLGYFGNEGTITPPTTNGDALTVTTLWREGNYDTATLSTIWDTNGAVTLPSSLYLTSKPSWWGSSAWPSIGSDLTPMVGTIPAELRFDAMGIPTAVLGGTGSGGGGTFGSWRTQ